MCGLFAWNGKDVKDFDWTKFNILGLLNDTRGGDSCGRSFGDYELKGIDAKSDYEALVKTYYNDDLDVSSIFGHTRKASVGGISLKTAQPITIKNEDNAIKFHLIHNGTLHNHLELAKKYDVDPVGKTDSQVLAQIIYDHGYAVLSEYIGAASLVFGWADTPNVIYAWRGESRLTEFATVEYDERPLNYFQESDNSIYINSLVEPLRFIGGEIAGDDVTVHEFEGNKLYTIVDGEIVDKSEIKRDKCFQRKSTYFNTGRNNHTQTRTNHATSSSISNTYNNETKPAANDLEGDEAPDAIKKTENLIYYAKGRYWYNKDFAHGIYFVNAKGAALLNQPKDKELYEKYYFIRGVLMADHTAFCLLAKKFKKGKRTSKNRKCEDDSSFSQLLRYSRYPIQSWIARHRLSGFLKMNGITSSSVAGDYFTGEFNPLFSSKCYKINVGNYTGFIGVGYNSPESLVEINIPNKDIVENDVHQSSLALIDAETNQSGNAGSEDDTPFIDTGENTDVSPNYEVDYQYDDSMVEDEIKSVLRDIDRVIMEAKSRVEQIGPTNQTTLALDLLEELQEKIDAF